MNPFKVGNTAVVYPDKGTILVRVPPEIKDELGAKGLKKAFVQQGQDWLMVLPWQEDAIMLMKNMGIDIVLAAPLVKRNQVVIEGKYAPMAHQFYTAAFMSIYPRGYILNDPRTGKTGSVVVAMDYMQRHGKVQGAFLIISTLTTVRSVWEATIRESIPTARVVVVHGKDREKLVDEPADFYVTNYDSCRLSERAFVDAVKTGRIGAVVIDELTNVGNTQSKRFKAIDAICNRTGLERVYGLTGSPGEDPETVFGMCKMVNRTRLPCTTKTSWLDRTTMQVGFESFMRKPRPEAPYIIQKAMQPAVRFAKKDIMDLPPVVTQDRQCETTSVQKRLREEFRAESVALLESGEAITAVNGGVLLQKLMQVAQGFVMNKDKETTEIDHAPRSACIIDAIAETDRKVVVFSCYRKGISLRVEQIKKAGFTCAYIDGSVPDKERTDILRRFQYEDAPHVLVCHPTTTAYGVELSRADTIIFDGPPLLGGFIYAQALERLSSLKQEADKISVIRVMTFPEEKRFFNALDKGREMGQIINTLFESISKGEL